MSDNDERIIVTPADHPVNITFNGAVLASTNEALVLTEKGYPPVYYIPKNRVEMAFFEDSDHRTTCPYKGEARYWSISAEGQAAKNAVWSYERPNEGVSAIAGYLAFDPAFVTIDTGR